MRCGAFGPQLRHVMPDHFGAFRCRNSNKQMKAAHAWRYLGSVNSPVGQHHGHCLEGVVVERRHELGFEGVGHFWRHLDPEAGGARVCGYFNPTFPWTTLWSFISLHMVVF
jgi:hypothetical protein